MNTPSFIIVADRGELKAFVVDKSPAGRSNFPRLVDSLFINESHQRYNEMFTDRAGGFPNAGSGGQGNSIAERMTLAAETETRTFQRLAQEMTIILKKHHPERWGFAAPSEINGAILDGVSQEYKKRLTVNLRQDLVNLPAGALLAHFENGE